MKHLLSLLILASSSIQMLAQADIKPTFVSGTIPGGSEGARMICDGKLSTKWCIDEPGQMPYFIILDAGRQLGVVEYGLVTGDDTNMYPERNPVTWRVSGSNDQQAWTLLDDRKNDRSLPAEGQQEYRFKPQASGQFRYYRFEFLRMAGGSRIQLSEINLYDKVQTPIKLAFVSTNTTTAAQTGRRRPTIAEDASMVADGFLHTKWCIDRPSQMPYTVTLDAGSQTAVSEYRFYTADDTHSYPERNPIAWRMSGSNDQQTWTTLDEQQSNRRLRDENEQEYRFKPHATGQFRYYRVEFLRMAVGTRLQLSEINLYK